MVVPGDLRKGVRRAVRVAGFGAVTAAMLPAFLAREAVTPLADPEPRRDAWVGTWAATLLRIFGVSAVMRGPIPIHGHGHLVVANHRSTADILVLLRAFGGHMVSRADLAGWPLVGGAGRGGGTGL